MTTRVRFATILRTITTLTALGLVTTALVTAALGAWLPNRSLSASNGSVHRYPGSQPRNFWQRPPGEEVRIDFSRLFRPGMERRSWRRISPGVTYMEHTIYSWHSAYGHIASVTRRDDAPEPHQQWGSLGSFLRGEPLPWHRATEDARGWPCLAAWCEIKEGYGSPCTVSGGLALPSNWTNVAAIRCIPLRPIWPGLALDTAFYAALWSLPVLCIPVARRHHRRHRGHCPICNYDLRAEFTAGCTECGWGR